MPTDTREPSIRANQIEHCAIAPQALCFVYGNAKASQPVSDADRGVCLLAQRSDRMTAREFGNQNHASSEPEPPTKAPSVISVDQWDYAQGKFVERLVANPDYKPYTCGECGTALRISEAKNYVGPLSTDGFRRKALVCEKCFEVLP